MLTGAPSPGNAAAVSSLGMQLRVLRVRAGLTQDALAERSGVGLATLKALERGQRQRPHPRTVAVLADALALSDSERNALLDLASPPVVMDSPAPATVASVRVVRLPVPPTALIGRDEEIAAVRTLLDPSPVASRLVTLIGPAGVGKTRLAVAAATTLTHAFADGVAFVDLAPLSDAQLVAPTIARALLIHETTRESLIDYLQSRRVLLLLDNFEHLLAARQVVLDILRSCPHVALLVTSRAALRLQAERRVVVGPLATPVAIDSAEAIADSPAVQLFVARALSAAADFTLTPSNAPAVAEICRRLDGLPLAIELAAARVRLLAPGTLLGRLERRLSLLTGGAAELPLRQQTLRNTLAWSVDLLAPTERALLCRLAVFAGGWTVEAAEAVADDASASPTAVLDGLQALVDSSLVQRLDDRPWEPRFGMLETVREYALEQLDLHDESVYRRERHGAFFLALAERAEPQLLGAEQRAWFDRLDRDLDNLRAALAWAHSSGNVESGLRLALALAVFCEERGHVREARAWLHALTRELSDTEPLAANLALLQARALATASWLAFLLGDYARAAPLAEQSLVCWQHLGQVGNSPVALNTLAYVARRDGDVARTEALFQQSLALNLAAGDHHGAAAVLSWLGTQRRASGDLERATALLDQALRLYKTTGAVGGIAYTLLHLGGVARARQDNERAQTLFEQSLALYQSLGDRSDVAYATGALAALVADRGDVVRARSMCEENAATFRALGDARGLCEQLRLLGRIATLQGDDRTAAAAHAECLALRHALRSIELAFSLEGVALALARLGTTRLEPVVRLLGAAAAVREQLPPDLGSNWSVAMPGTTHPGYAVCVASLRSALGEAAFETAWSAGLRRPVDQAVAEAQAITEAHATT